MKSVLVILIGSVAALAGPKEYEDEVHPRRPGTPLEIVYKPYYCAVCLKEGRIEGEPRTIRMMRMPVEKLAKECEVGRNWIAIETPHFRIFSNLRRSKIKPSDGRFTRADLERLRTIFRGVNPAAAGLVLDAHQRTHLYHIRAERIYAHFAALMDCEKKWLGMLSPYQLYLFDQYNEHHVFVDKYIGRANDKSGMQHHVREKPNFMMYTIAESQVSGGDQLLANTVVHNVAHNLVDGYGNYFRETWAFLEEGLAHYYERRENPRYNTFCWSEGKSPTMFKKPNWESTILNLVRRGKDTPLSQWCEKIKPGELTGIEQGLSWSIIRWMVETDPLRFAKMVDKLQDYKTKPTATQTIEFAFGLTPTALHVRWREYVLEEYAKKK